MNSATLLDIVFGVFAFLSLLAGGAGYYKGAAAKAQMAALRDAADDLRKDLTDADRRVTLLTSEATEERLRRESLEKVVTGQKQLEEIARVLSVHDSRAKQMQQVLNGTYELAEKLVDLVETVHREQRESPRES